MVREIASTKNIYLSNRRFCLSTLARTSEESFGSSPEKCCFGPKLGLNAKTFIDKKFEYTFHFLRVAVIEHGWQMKHIRALQVQNVE
jgi:hypothetical protein